MSGKIRQRRVEPNEAAEKPLDIDYDDSKKVKDEMPRSQ